jgi:hypothetical protein
MRKMDQNKIKNIIDTAKEVYPQRYARAKEISYNVNDYKDYLSSEAFSTKGDELIYNILLVMKVYPDLQS